MNDLKTTLGLEYGVDKVLIGPMSILPDHVRSSDGKYRYWISFIVIKRKYREEIEAGTFYCKVPLTSLEDVRAMEKVLRRDSKAKIVALLSCQPLYG